MRITTFLFGLAVAGTATAAAAQAAPPAHQHDQHQATGQNQPTDQHKMAAAGEKCCCEEMMKKMMSEMMQKHQGMEMQMQKDAPPQPDHAH
jgi:hypothetical protein